MYLILLIVRDVFVMFVVNIIFCVFLGVFLKILVCMLGGRLV